MTSPTPKPARDTLHDALTRQVVAQMEAGTVPWTPSWDASLSPIALPRNAATGRRYSGFNVLLLWGAQTEGRHALPRWLTYRQAQGLGGSVRRGERGTTVCFADRFIPKAERRRARLAGEDPVPVLYLKRYTVFNVAQCEGLDPEHYAPPAPTATTNALAACAATVAATEAVIRHGGPRAAYAPLTDVIHMPRPEAFETAEDYYRTLFHELVHWTGHTARLDRGLAALTDPRAYAREELVAEMGAAFLAAEHGLMPSLRHASYLQHWIGVLKSDTKALTRAASMASRAVDLVAPQRDAFPIRSPDA